MSLTFLLARALVLVVVAVIAVLVGVAVAFGSALLGHEILVLRYGPDLSPIDDTLPMYAAVWGAYAAGFVAGLLVLAVGWWWLVRPARPRQGRGHS